MRRIIMFNHRIIFLTIIGATFVPMFSMKGNLDRIIQAAKTGDLTTIQTLDPDGTNQAITNGEESGLTPLYSAALNGQLAIVDYYVKKLESQGKDINPAMTGVYHGKTPLYIAADIGHLAIVEYYVKKLESQGKEINPAITIEGRCLGWTPLHIAACEGQLTIVDYYVKKLEKQNKEINPAITTGEYLGWTPLYAAARKGKPSVVDYLVKKIESQGKDINPVIMAGFSLGCTPLFIAAREGHVAIVDYLVKKLESQGKDINLILNDGWWPMHSAALNGHPNIVKIFIYRGALLSAKNGMGQTVEDVARTYNHQDLANYLHTNAPLTLLLLDACNRTKSLIAQLTENYQKLSHSQQDRMRADCAECIVACQDQIQRSLQRIKQLIERGADENVQGKKGCAPLHCLIGYYNWEGPTQLDETVCTLMGMVRVNAVADNGDTALSLAAQYGNSRIFKYLLKNFANPTVGKNPFLVALQHNQPQILRYLLMGPQKQTSNIQDQRSHSADETKVKKSKDAV